MLGGSEPWNPSGGAGPGGERRGTCADPLGLVPELWKASSSEPSPRGATAQALRGDPNATESGRPEFVQRTARPRPPRLPHPASRDSNQREERRLERRGWGGAKRAEPTGRGEGGARKRAAGK